MPNAQWSLLTSITIQNQYYTDHKDRDLQIVPAFETNTWLKRFGLRTRVVENRFEIYWPANNDGGFPWMGMDTKLVFFLACMDVLFLSKIDWPLQQKEQLLFASNKNATQLDSSFIRKRFDFQKIHNDCKAMKARYQILDENGLVVQSSNTPDEKVLTIIDNGKYTLNIEGKMSEFYFTYRHQAPQNIGAIEIHTKQISMKQPPQYQLTFHPRDIYYRYVVIPTEDTGLSLSIHSAGSSNEKTEFRMEMAIKNNKSHYEFTSLQTYPFQETPNEQFKLKVEQQNARSLSIPLPSPSPANLNVFKQGDQQIIFAVMMVYI